MCISSKQMHVLMIKGCEQQHQTVGTVTIVGWIGRCIRNSLSEFVVDVNDSQARSAIIVEIEVLEMYFGKTAEKICLDVSVVMIGVDVGCCDRSIEEDTQLWLTHGTGIWICQSEASEVNNIF